MFRTEIPFTPDSRQLSRSARVLTLGSCFADSIGGRLVANKVNALVNPFGTIFNPLSATLLLRAAAGIPTDWSQHLVEARGRWQSYDLHGSIGADSAEELLAQIQELVQRTAEFVRTADVLALTLGTAWVYRLRETGELVSNCHKMPATLFEKELLTAEDIVGSLAETHALLRRLNPKLRFVLTVSPVRHLRDTLPLNSVSKSVLRLATHYLSDLLPDVSYFPAYELLTDDLRDYRFYAADMLHPSAVAEDYIWERFARTYFDADFGRFRKEWDGIQQALGHRPLHSGAPEHRQFLEATRERLRRLAEREVDVQEEIQAIERRLAELPLPRVVPTVTSELEDDGEERIDIGATDLEPDGLATTEDVISATDGHGAASLVPVVAPEQAAESLRAGRNKGRNRSGRRNKGKEANPVLAEAQATDHEQPQAAVATVPVPELAPVPAPHKPSYTDFLISSALDLVQNAPAKSVSPVLTPEPQETIAETSPAIDVTAEEPAKKKKRRSRGGAKRTARKNAARLATEQGSSGADAMDEGDEHDEPTDAEVTGNEADVTSVAEIVATPVDVLPAVDATGAAESEQPTASPDAAAESAAPEAASGLAENTGSVDAATDEAAPATTADEAVSPDADAVPETHKRRGTGPAAKKSKVITKSEPVKRGNRRSPRPLFNTPAPAAVSQEEAPVHTAAPSDVEPVTFAAELTTLAELPVAEPAASVTPPTEQTAPPAKAKRKPASKAAAPKAAPSNPAKQAAPRPSRAKKAGADDAPTVAAPAASAPAAASEPTPTRAIPGAVNAPAQGSPKRRIRPPRPKKPKPDGPAAS